MSSKFGLNKEDLLKILKNILIFVLPDLIIFLGAISAKLDAEGAFIAVLGLNILIDVLKRFLAGK